MLVGEQPGDQEDLAGAPFVGPAGKLLDQAPRGGRIDRRHDLRHERGQALQVEGSRTRRIHDKPTWTEAMACRPWLDAELALVKPRALVLMGATAAQALVGKSFKVTQERGRPLDSELADLVIATIHPSAVLRAENRDEMFAELVVRPARRVRTFAH